MWIVTGGTGQLGGAIVRELAHRVPPSQIGVMAREPAKAEGLAALGVQVRRGDFVDPTSLAHAFEGATQVLVVSSNARRYGGDPIAQHRAAIEAAKVAGARRIVYTSHMAANGGSAFPPMLDHAETEPLLAGSGLRWTSLRNGFYAASGLALLQNALETGVMEAPADGPVCWTTHEDLAAAAAAVLTTAEGRFEGPTPPLTGRETFDLAGLASLAGDILGRNVERRMLDDESLRARLAAGGAPPAVAEIALGLHRASRAGEFAKTDPTLEALIGRPPVSMRAFLAAQLGA